MPYEVSSSLDSAENSFDLVEEILDDADWSYERDSNNSVHCIAPTRWGDLGSVFTMRQEPRALQFTVTLDVKPTPSRRGELNALITLINEKMGIGHFDYWTGDDLILYRHAIPMAGRLEPESSEISAVIESATEAAECYTPAMNYIIWAGMTAEQAMQIAQFETHGEA